MKTSKQTSNFCKEKKFLQNHLPSLKKSIKLFNPTCLLLLFMLLNVQLGRGATAIYTIASKTSVTASGTAPSGSTATYAQTYTTQSQMTSGNSSTLTLSGYAGYKITSITLSMKSNTSAGAGSLSVVAGSTSILSISDSKFNTSTWNGAWSTSYVDITRTPTAYAIGTGESVVIKIAATTNSLYIASYSVTYESAVTHTVTFNSNYDTPTTSTQTASSSTALTTNTFTRTGYTFAGWATTSGGSVAYTNGAAYGFASDLTLYAQWTASSCTDPGLAYATISVSKVVGDAAFTNTLTAGSGSGAITYSSSNTSVATVSAAGLVTIVGAGSTTITASKAANGTYCADNTSYTLSITSGASTCPVIEGAMVNSCTSGSTEGNNEYFVFSTGATSGAISLYTMKFGSNTSLTTAAMSGASATTKTGTGTITTSCPYIAVTSPSTVIPANSRVVFIPSVFDWNIDLSGFCSGSPLYIVYINPSGSGSSWSSTGNFTNSLSSGETRYLGLFYNSSTYCDIESYAGSYSSSDGGFVSWSSGSAVATNNGCSAVSLCSTPPTALVLTGSTVCGTSGTITSSTSASGISYQLYNSSGTAVGSALSGTGSALTWSSITSGTGYYVIATSGICTSTSNAVNVVVNAVPTLSGANSVSVGSTITLTPSITGGTWNSSNTAAATVSAGVVTGVSDGTTVITYTTAAGCPVTGTITSSSITYCKKILAAWDFEDKDLLQDRGYATSTISNIGGTTTTWDKTGIDPSNIGTSESTAYTDTQAGIGFQTTSYPSQSSSSLTAGVKIAINTTGYKNIKFEFDIRHSEESSNTNEIQYTTDGTNWVTCNSYIIPTSGCEKWYYRTYDFSSISAANNNSNFAIRLVSKFKDGSKYYSTKDNTTSGYASGSSGGKYRFDNIVFTGDTITPVLKITNPASVCSPSTVNLKATAVTAGSTSGYAYTYWTNAAASSSLSTAAAVTTSGTYYIKVALADTISGVCSVTKPVVATINSVPTISGTLSICGTGSTTLTGSATAATTNPWVSSSTGVASITSSGVVTGISSGTSLITYTNSNGCSKTATVKVNAIPTAIVADGSMCGPGIINFSAVSDSASSTYKWYETLSSSTVISTAAIYNTPTLSTTISYYVTATANGCTSARTKATAIICPLKATWTGAVSTDWNIAGNWSSTEGGVPTACTDVIIPSGTTNYPTISTTGVCHYITFKPEAGVLGLQNLTYERAYVETTVQRNKWYTLTSPLKNMYSGDYYFSGTPVSNMKLFDAINPDSISTSTYKYVGTWTKSFANLQTPLTPANGYAFMLSSTEWNYPNGKSTVSTDKTITFPRTNADGTLVTSLIPYSSLNGYQYTKLAVSLPKDASTAYRFANENASNKLGDITISLKQGLNLVGNPLMTHLDFSKLYADNTGKIRNAVKLWNGTTFTTFMTGASFEGSSAMGDFTATSIPPMQSFFVYSDVVGGTTMTIKPGSHFTTNTTSKLRSSKIDSNRLYIESDNGSKKSATALAFNESAVNEYGDDDAFKLFSQYTDVPEVYTLAGDKALDINQFGSLPYTVPLGLLSSKTDSLVKLTFNGAESFDGVTVNLVNTLTGETQNLKENPTYAFNYDGTNGEGVLFLEFRSASVSTDVVTTAASTGIQVFSKDKSTIRVISSPSDLIKEIAVYDEVGRTVNQATTVNSSCHDIIIRQNQPFCVVKVITENQVKISKLMMK